MTRAEFYEKYKKIVEQREIEGSEIYHKALAIIFADTLLDEEVGNKKELNVDDFEFTIAKDSQLALILGIKFSGNIPVKAKDMYDVQLYRLLLDAYMLSLNADLPKGCFLLSPCAVKTAEILKLGIYWACDGYATEDECNSVLDLLSVTDNLNNTTEDLFKFCEIMLEAYRFINDETLFNIQPDLTDIVLGKKNKNYGFNVPVVENSIIDAETYIRTVKDNLVRLLLTAFNDDMLLNLFKICRTPKNLSVNLYGVDITASIELKTVLQQYIKIVGDINNIRDFDKQQYFELLKIWFSINK